MQKKFNLMTPTNIDPPLVAHVTKIYPNPDGFDHTQRRVQPDQCYFTVQITGINFECNL